MTIRKENNREIIAQKYQRNREVRLEQAKQYYVEHRDQVMVRTKQKFECECGGRYVYSAKVKHEQQLCHLRYLLSKSIPITVEQKALVDAAPVPNCPCGGRTTYANKSTHFKSPGHQRYLAQQALLVSTDSASTEPVTPL